MKKVLVDASFIAHRAKHSVGRKGLSFQGHPTAIIMGMLEQLRVTCCDKRVLSNQVHLFFDSRISVRKELLPEYKSKRHEKENDNDRNENRVMYAQMKFLRNELLPEAGFATYIQKGLESDDLIAYAARYLASEGAVIITGDYDLYQCVDEHVDWFNPARNLYVDTATLLQTTQLPPDDYGLMKCMSGCDSDCVPGIPGIGPKTATDFIWKLLKKGSVKRKAIQSIAGKRIIERNKQLILLPHWETKDFALKSVEYRPKTFFKALKKLGMASLVEGDRRREWEKFFAGEFKGVRDREVTIGDNSRSRVKGRTRKTK